MSPPFFQPISRHQEPLARAIFFLSALACSLTVLIILGFMVVTGLPLLEHSQWMDLLTGAWYPVKQSYGIAPMVLGTLWISFLGVIIALPISLGCASYICVLGPHRTRYILKGCVGMMTGIPTVIYAFAGVFLLVPFIRNLGGTGSGMCILTASLVLAILIAPTMILFFMNSFENVPPAWLDAVDALGGSKVQALVYIIIPACKKGIVTGTVLAFGRAIGDTLVALMLAGNAVQRPDSLFDSARTLTAHIALVSAADFASMEFKSIFLCGTVLYVITTIVILVARTMERTGKQTKDPNE
ncbi:PstC3 [Desulforapulum autotrophicum HRM2]|uniref:PstC3 n=1 Tax=Desulforapulum autotrophicum (strain ATCC 43914 / DSM 3382 / VKM B-1955 / HRM2) TaxID=177437 RepID=C0QJC6_DESAH|nr:ABC transporter permease subunit [Desulforapulum autotrophicum]ACN15939.1 PstC3 [Desulforapulum autotrophicum HRM2]